MEPRIAPENGKLIADMYGLLKQLGDWEKYKLQSEDVKYFKPNLPPLIKKSDVHTLVHTAVHRLQWLELVVLGMSYREQSDAVGYAKFVRSKRKLEDLDIDELRILLREK